MNCRLCGCEDIRCIHHGTRDRADIDVMRCSACGLVFLSETSADASWYQQGQMRPGMTFDQWRKNTKPDDARRFETHSKILAGKNVLDFGCGNGGFLELVKHSGLAKRIVGVELDQEAAEYINKMSIECHGSLEELGGERFDLIFLFHVLEHLAEPEAGLKALAEHLTPDGRIVIEVPNADDALLRIYHCEAFADFTYWSAHLWLFTEKTLEQVVRNAGFRVEKMEQFQRYPLANHLGWLSKGRPGGGQRFFQELSLPELNKAYASALAGLKCCDTLCCQIRREI